MDALPQDIYRTVDGEAGVTSRERNSKFLAFAYPVENEDQIKERLEELRKRYFDATHHCYAWRLGADGGAQRANDDGEPSGSAGRPILGQILSAGITNVLVVVVRYFGGTKLGVPGLIKAYKEAAEGVLNMATIVERTVERNITLEFAYERQGDAMRLVKEQEARILRQNFDNVCRLVVAVPESRADAFEERFHEIMNRKL